MLDPYNIGIYQGTSYRADVQWKDDVTQTLVDLTGATVILQARYYYGGPAIIESSTTNGRITLDTTSHTISITISPAQTLSVKTIDKPLLYDVLLKLNTGIIYKIMVGNIQILPTVAKLP